MFIVSQYILYKSNVIPDVVTVSTYSVVIGLIVYASVYVYFLMYNRELLPFFNKIIIYIIGIDLLLSTIYYYSIQSSKPNPESNLLINEINSETFNYSEDYRGECDIHEKEYDSDDEYEDTESENETDIDNIIENYSSSMQLKEHEDEHEDNDNYEHNEGINMLNKLSNTMLPDQQIQNEFHLQQVNEEQNVIKKRKRRTKKEIEQEMLEKQKELENTNREVIEN